MKTSPIIVERNMRFGLPGRCRKRDSPSPPKANRRYLRLTPLFLVLLLLLLISDSAMPQRHGRPYSASGVLSLQLEVSSQKETHYFSAYDLRKMPRSSLIATDTKTNESHLYEGVALERVAPTTTLGFQGSALEIQYDSHQTLTISGDDLDRQTQSIVADSVDGKPLPLDAPFSFVAELRGKPALPIVDVRSISVKSF